MTALSLELMDITRDCVPSFMLLYQVFTAADSSCCFFVGLSYLSDLSMGLSLVLSSASDMHAQSG